jgi:hypothetical protein
MTTTIEKDNIRLEIIQDETPINPRSTEWTDCNIVKMICFSKRYNLGDKHDYKFHDYNNWDEMKADIIRNEKPLVIQPLYFYEHSGCSISTSPFGCRWDSGQIGFAIITKEMIRKTFNVKHVLKKKWYDKSVEMLNGEVETYDQYLTGDVYGFELYEDDEETDSCSGFYGDDFWKNGMSENIGKDIIEKLKKELEKEFGVCP